MNRHVQTMRLLDTLAKEHRAAVAALDRSHRYTGGTASWRKAFESFEKHSEAFDFTMRKIEVLMTGGDPKLLTPANGGN